MAVNINPKPPRKPVYYSLITPVPLNVTLFINAFRPLSWQGIVSEFRKGEIKRELIMKLGFVGLAPVGSTTTRPLIWRVLGHQTACHNHYLRLISSPTHCSLAPLVLKLSWPPGNRCIGHHFIMVPDTPQVETVLFGENGCNSLGEGQKVPAIDMSSFPRLKLNVSLVR